MAQTTLRSIVFALALCGISCASNAANKCLTKDKLHGGQVTTSEALYGGDAQSLVDCNPDVGYANLPNYVGWFRVELPQASCIKTLRMRPTMVPSGTVTLRLAVEDADGSVLSEHTEAVAMEDAVWHVHKLDQKTCGVKFVRFETLSSPSWVGWLDLQGR